MLTRRSALFVLAAPAFVRAASLMPVRALARVDLTLQTTHYVDPNWLGPRLGTRAFPWQTMQQAYDWLDGKNFGAESVTINILGNLTFERKLQFNDSDLRKIIYDNSPPDGGYRGA